MPKIKMQTALCPSFEDAFERLEKMRKKAPDLDYEAELAAYREEKYGHASVG